MNMVELWMHGISSKDPQGSVRMLKDLGFSVMVLGSARDQHEMARDVGLDTYVCTGTFSRSGEFSDESFLAVDIEGVPREWFGSTCPNRKEVREKNISTVESALSETEAKGLMLDGCRFASPASGLGAFFTCFCHVCEQKAKEMGYDFGRMKRDVRTLYKSIVDRRLSQTLQREPFEVANLLTSLPGVCDWLSFRADCTIEHFENVTDVVKEMGAEMGAYIFTPCLSGLVGQRYSRLRRLLDVVSPMIYRNYPDDPGPACLNKEAAALARYISQGGFEESEAASMVTWFLGLPEQRSIDEIDAAVPEEAVALEADRAARMFSGGPSVLPIIYLGDEKVASTALAVSRTPVDGVNFFTYRDGLEPAIELVSKRLSAE